MALPWFRSRWRSKLPGAILNFPHAVQRFGNATVSEQNQMAALLLGLETALYLSNRLRVYMAYLTTLPASLARNNFETCLVEFHVLILQFLAHAMRIYQKGSITRAFDAFWRVEDVATFENKCDKMADRAEIEASNSDRDLNAINRAAVKRQQEDLRQVLKEMRDHREQG
ncbi:hypothetical protein DV736_g5785, partial [Chaetothyriales sp. CBS 134916]